LVGPITGLFCRLSRFAHTIETAVGGAFIDAGTNTLAHTHRAGIAQPGFFDDSAIAVLVDLVAQFLDGLTRDSIAGGLAVLTADEHPISNACAHANGTRITQAQAFIDGVVAIVVYTVTHLVIGQAREDAT